MGRCSTIFRSPNCGPACSCSLIGEGRCSRSGSDGSRPSPSVPCSRPARPYRGAPGPMKPVPVQTARRGRRPEGLPPAASTSGRGCRIFILFSVKWRSSCRAVSAHRPVGGAGMPAAECLVIVGSDVKINVEASGCLSDAFRDEDCGVLPLEWALWARLRPALYLRVTDDRRPPLSVRSRRRTRRTP